MLCLYCYFKEDENILYAYLIFPISLQWLTCWKSRDIIKRAKASFENKVDSGVCGCFASELGFYFL